MTDNRSINKREAETVYRIFCEYAAGASPRAIARKLNQEGIPGPHGRTWQASTIRGHHARHTGILYNELYIGRLVWNRLRYIRNPETGHRVSRINPLEALVIVEVPHLRIGDDNLWERVKARQAETAALPVSLGIKKSCFWEQRRPRYLSSGKKSVGRDYLACNNAGYGTCGQRMSLRRNILEAQIVALLRDQLTRPEAVETFLLAYAEEINVAQNETVARRKQKEGELRAVQVKLDGLYDAIADGLRTPGLLAKVESFETEKAHLETALESPPPAIVQIRPDISELYRSQIGELGEALADPTIRNEAIGILQKLISRIEIGRADDCWNIELQGDMASLIAFGARTNKNAPHWCSRVKRYIVR
jgi:site-specific DNA recombinase